VRIATGFRTAGKTRHDGVAHTVERTGMATPAEALAHWHEFYTLLGTAAGTLVGLLFVAATIASGVFSSGRPAPLRVFLSTSVVHFGDVLVVSLIVLAPIESWILFGAMVLACGLAGIGYYGFVLRDAARDGLMAAIDLEDRVWYAILPVVGYLAETTSGLMLAMHVSAGIVLLAATIAALLLVGIHNAWDITVWTVQRRQE
jgi:hypothetical protein